MEWEGFVGVEMNQQEKAIKIVYCPIFLPKQKKKPSFEDTTMATLTALVTFRGLCENILTYTTLLAFKV